MVDTIDDISVSNSEYVSANALSGIAVGTALAASNKSNSIIRIQTAAAKPEADSTRGMLLAVFPYSDATRLVTAGESTTWLISMGVNDAKVNIQDNS